MTDFDELIIFEALSIAQNTKAHAVRSISTTQASVSMNYCIPLRFAKRQTDVSGAETEDEIGPDTGPAGAMIEIGLIIDRNQTGHQDVLQTLLQWYGNINTKRNFRGGFLGLENTDNPALNLNPKAQLGYKLIGFNQINPSDSKGQQLLTLTLQFEGDVKDLPVFENEDG